MNEEIIEALNREELVISSKNKRIFAFLIDEVLLSFITMLILWDKISGERTYEEILLALQPYIMYTLALKIIYHTFFVMQFSASPGKIMMKIKIIELSSFGEPSFMVSLNRSIVRMISEVLFYAGFIWGLLDPLSRTWHDKTARTVVVDV